VNYLLDTNACIAVINGRPSSVRARFQRVIAPENKVFVSSVVAFELWYGLAESSQTEASRQNLQGFFAGPVVLLAFDHEDAETAGVIRAALEAQGKPIGAYDLLIAGQALRRKLTLVTANVREFATIKGLTWQDWSKQG